MAQRGLEAERRQERLEQLDGGQGHGGHGGAQVGSVSPRPHAEVARRQDALPRAGRRALRARGRGGGHGPRGGGMTVFERPQGLAAGRVGVMSNSSCWTSGFDVQQPLLDVWV